MPLGTEVGLSPGHIMLDRDPWSSSQKRGTDPDIWPMSVWPTAAWIKMQLGSEADLSPGDIVLHGT